MMDGIHHKAVKEILIAIYGTYTLTTSDDFNVTDSRNRFTR